DYVCDQREDEEHQEHPRDALKRLYHRPVKLENPAFGGEFDDPGIFVVALRRDVLLQLMDPDAGGDAYDNDGELQIAQPRGAYFVGDDPFQDVLDRLREGAN